MNDKREFTGVWIPKHIIEDKQLKPVDRLIYAEISCFDICTMTNKTLSDRAGCSEDTASRSVGRLKEKGYIQIVGFNGRVRKMQSQHITPPQNEEAASAKAPKLPPQNKAQDNNIENNKKTNTTTNNDTLLKELLNKVTGRNFRVLPNGYKKTLKEFTLEEIEKALLAMKKDKWHSERWGSLKSDYLIRSSTIDNFLNKKSSGYNQSVSAEDLYGDGSWMK